MAEFAFCFCSKIGLSQLVKTVFSLGRLLSREAAEAAGGDEGQAAREAQEARHDSAQAAGTQFNRQKIDLNTSLRFSSLQTGFRLFA